jgi:protein-serine/threonine kinase
MDLFDYIELRTNMTEAEAQSIFRQVVDAIHHLHTKALVVHRDIKDENVVLDGEGRIKLIDFGSAAYIKNGPFDVFVGTIGKEIPIPTDPQADLHQITLLRKCCKDDPTVVRHKMFGHWGFCCTLLRTKKVSIRTISPGFHDADLLPRSLLQPRYEQ